MRLGGRLAGAIEVLDDIEARRRPVADAFRVRQRRSRLRRTAAGDRGGEAVMP